MNEIADERVAFYLKHQALIDTWAAVAADAARDAHRFYLSLADDLSQLAGDLDPDAEVWVRDGSYSNVGLYKTPWGSPPGGPLVAVALEWRKDKTGFRGDYRISGLRIDWEHPRGKAIRATLGDLVRPHRVSVSFPASSSWWAAYRPFPEPEAQEYWKDLRPFRSALVSEVIDAWTAFAGHVDQAVLRPTAQA